MSGSAACLFAVGMNAAYWNPAGLSRSENGATVFASNDNILQIFLISFFGAGSNFGRNENGLTIKSFNLGDINETTVEAMDGTGHFTLQI